MEKVLADIAEIEDIAAHFAEAGKTENAAFLRQIAEQHKDLYAKASDFFGWFNRTYPDPGGNAEHPIEQLGQILFAMRGE